MSRFKIKQNGNDRMMNKYMKMPRKLSLFEDDSELPLSMDTAVLEPHQPGVTFVNRESGQIPQHSKRVVSKETNVTAASI